MSAATDAAPGPELALKNVVISVANETSPQVVKRYPRWSLLALRLFIRPTFIYTWPGSCRCLCGACDARPGGGPDRRACQSGTPARRRRWLDQLPHGRLWLRKPEFLMGEVDSDGAEVPQLVGAEQAGYGTAGPG